MVRSCDWHTIFSVHFYRFFSLVATKYGQVSPWCCVTVLAIWSWAICSRSIDDAKHVKKTELWLFISGKKSSWVNIYSCHDNLVKDQRRFPLNFMQCGAQQHFFHSPLVLFQSQYGLDPCTAYTDPNSTQNGAWHSLSICGVRFLPDFEIKGELKGNHRHQLLPAHHSWLRLSFFISTSSWANRDHVIPGQYQDTIWRMSLLVSLWCYLLTTTTCFSYRDLYLDRESRTPKFSKFHTPHCRWHDIASRPWEYFFPQQLQVEFFSHDSQVGRIFHLE